MPHDGIPTDVEGKGGHGPLAALPAHSFQPEAEESGHTGSATVFTLRAALEHLRGEKYADHEASREVFGRGSACRYREALTSLLLPKSAS